METIDFDSSRINIKKQIWIHGENDTKIDISALDKTQKEQAIEYLECVLKETKSKLLDEFLPKEKLENYKLLIKTINAFLIELRVPTI